jgi:hypothetical protein
MLWRFKPKLKRKFNLINYCIEFITNEIPSHPPPPPQRLNRSFLSVIGFQFHHPQKRFFFKNDSGILINNQVRYFQVWAERAQFTHRSPDRSVITEWWFDGTSNPKMGSWWVDANNYLDQTSDQFTVLNMINAWIFIATIRVRMVFWSPVAYEFLVF